MSFEQALQYLLSLGHETLAIKLGLRNTALLLESLGNPHRSYESVQIAGTNGKGSTAVVLDSICRASGIKTGLYTSPHLVSITERIVIGGHDISEDDFAKLATRVRETAEDLVARGALSALPTFFEQVTAIALLAYREAGVKLAILETGMGGRLDATTVAAAATVAITPLALDHQEHLGQTLREIAFEKAAIIRPGVTAIVAAQPAPGLEVIVERCVECNVKPIVDDFQTTIESTTSDGRFRVTFQTNEERYESVLLGLRGRHQIQNSGIALGIAESLRRRGFEIPKTAIIEGIETAEYPGRLELHEGSPSLLFDGAHNPSGVQALREYLDEFVAGPVTLVFGVMSDKKREEMAEILFPAAQAVVLARPDNPRAADLQDLKRLATDFVKGKAIAVAGSSIAALQRAKHLTPSNGVICVTGSLYLVGEIKAMLSTDALSCVKQLSSK